MWSCKIVSGIPDTDFILVFLLEIVESVIKFWYEIEIP